MATAPACCFGRGVGLSPRASGKRASCHLVRQRATWSNGRGGRGGWLRRTGRSHCAAFSVMWGTHRAKTLSLSGDSDDFIVTRIMIWTSNCDNLIIDASLSFLFRYATNQAPETYGS